MQIDYDNYYGAIFHLEVPPGELTIPFGPYGLGGSLMMHYFHKDSTTRPVGKTIWYMVNTFRYYAGLEDDGENDKYSSHTMVSNLKTEDEMDKAAVEILSKLAVTTGLSRFECVNLRCAGGDFLRKVKEADKDWLTVNEERLAKENPDLTTEYDEQ